MSDPPPGNPVPPGNPLPLGNPVPPPPPMSPNPPNVAAPTAPSGDNGDTRVRRWWRRFVRRAGRMARAAWPRTLRTRLVLALVALVAVLGAVISATSASLLHGYLVQRLDRQLVAASQRGMAAVGESGTAADTIVATLGQSPGTIGAIISRRGIDISMLTPAAGAETISPRAPQRLLSVPVDGTPTTVDLGGGLGEYRVSAAALRPDVVLLVGLPLDELNATVARLAWVILAATAAAVLLVAGAGTLLVSLALRPLRRVAGTATEVSELPLDRGEVALAVRLRDADADPRSEVGRVGASVNRMLDHVASALTAREASESKVRRFVADASHELRTPLASIRGYAELPRRSGAELPPDTVHALARIEAESERMTSLVEELLMLARLDEGIPGASEPVDLSRLVVETVGDAHAAGREHHWRLDVPAEPVRVNGDEPQLRRLLLNLLTNARVHTPPGTTVSVALGVEGADAVLSVSDDGPGIPEALQPNLFERFTRGDDSRSRATGSTGLGLAIVRAVTTAHGGRVTVRSEPGATTFRVTLPLGPREP